MFCPLVYANRAAQTLETAFNALNHNLYIITSIVSILYNCYLPEQKLRNDNLVEEEFISER